MEVKLYVMFVLILFAILFHHFKKVVTFLISFRTALTTVILKSKIFNHFQHFKIIASNFSLLKATIIASNIKFYAK